MLTRPNFLPLWSPDGETLTFERGTGAPDIYSVRLDETADMRPLTSSNDSSDIPVSYSPDGRLAFLGTRTGIGTGVFVLSADKVEEFLVTPAREASPMFSPNGRFIAYVSDESGQDEVYIRPSASSSGRGRQVSSDGGTQPAWSHNGRDLYYRSNSNMMVVRDATDLLAPTTPEALFVDRFLKSSGITPEYDVAADGQFLMVEEDPDDSVRVTVVQNWFERLKRLVPTDN